MTTPTHWYVYHSPATSLSQRLTDALARYAQHHCGAKPTHITLSRALTEPARALLITQGIEIIGNGGTLANEVWLPVYQEEMKL